MKPFKNIMLNTALLIVFFGMGQGPVLASSNAQQEQTVREHHVFAQEILGEAWMSGELHKVYPYAIIDHDRLRFKILTDSGDVVVKGTQDTRIYIQELYITDILKSRSTSGVVLQSTGARMANLVKTPVRAVKAVGKRTEKVDSVGDAALFIPDLTLDVAGGLLHGVGELFVTGQRLTSSVGSTKCEGLNCVGKAGEDIWSGVNSLMGKHNAARKLHSEFGTDPQTENRAYRRQIDRISYAESYIGTAVKLGVGNAGVDVVSPWMTSVGYYNNGEFLTGYEDAHRRRNFEKGRIVSWGISRPQVEDFYKSEAFTKLQRRRFFIALETIHDQQLKRRIFDEAYWAPDRAEARGHLARAEHIAEFAKQGLVTLGDKSARALTVITHDGKRITPIYADLLNSNSHIAGPHAIVKQTSVQNEIHVLGRASQRFVNMAVGAGFSVVQFPQ